METLLMTHELPLLMAPASLMAALLAALVIRPIIHFTKK
jgi:hypothetical protein